MHFLSSSFATRTGEHVDCIDLQLLLSTLQMWFTIILVTNEDDISSNYAEND